MATNQLSKPGAFAMGLLFIVCGIPAMLVGLGVITPAQADPETPLWLATCIGLMFAMAGVAIVVDYGIAGGMGPDGDLRPGTPFTVRVVNLVLGMTILGLMIAVFGWVAFGSGPRRFSSTVMLPFVSRSTVGGETSGRIAFGAATVVMAAMFVVCSVVGVERLWRNRRR